MAETSVIMRNPMCFINETHYVGRVKSVGCEMTKKMTTVGGLGGVGSVEVPTGKYEATTATVEFASIANGDVVQLNKNDGFVKLRMTAQVRMLDASTGTRIIDQAVTRIHGFVKNPPVPGYNDDGSPYTAQIAVLFIEILNTSGRIFMVDFVNGVTYPDGSPGEYGITVSL
ncbi:phage major tail tube protein [Aliivibrio salmonicida]|uniref:phage major tail tube protein n=1 Tax=Aliivibrio salmonicida TaxID=40269 RepID=UPI00406CD84F